MRKTVSSQVERLTLREKVVAYLHNEIVHHKLKPGEKITEIGLSRQLSISRTPIREAFYQLEAEGFLVVEPRKGVSVAELNAGDINNYYEIRKVLEGYAARCAAPSVSGLEIMQLKRLNRRYLRLVQTGRSSGMGIVRAHNKFHEQIVKLGKNPRMLEIYTDLGQRCLRFRFMATAIINIDYIRRDHDEIIAALEKGDGPGAEEAVRENADRGLNALLEALPSHIAKKIGLAA
ncbi:MAG: GntR family transcriptional regulator [Pseudomonadota bacterium]|nr:GntR family transcriptional regulator [Pseudomonadota bacterium]